MQIYKIKNTRLKLESRIFHLHKIFYSAVSYLDETALNRLCGYVAEYYLLDTLPKVEPIKVDSQLKTIDIMHFGWNIGKAFSKPRLQTATFIKRVFTHTLRDSEISTIERKMSHTESECKIKLDRKIA